MTDQLQSYWFPGNAVLTQELRAQFIPDGDGDEMVAMIGGATLRFGALAGRPGVIVETGGETVFIVYERFAEPFQPGAQYLNAEDF
jgi:hypothetical protein